MHSIRIVESLTPQFFIYKGSTYDHINPYQLKNVSSPLIIIFNNLSDFIPP